MALDYVGSLENAAIVISRLHRGEKRLVFVDSRAKAEQLGAALRQLDVTTFVTHSSLSQEQRHQAEQAFAAVKTVSLSRPVFSSWGSTWGTSTG